MRILMIHNSYQQPGGEDVVFSQETALLRAHGHEVLQLTASNHHLREISRLRAAANTIWNREVYWQVKQLLAEQRPDVIHCHNLFPILSPSVYDAAQRAGIPVVQTLHNYRLLCPDALLYRAGQPCRECLGKSMPYPAVLHACYRGSRAATAVTAAMLTYHRLRKTWQHKVTVFIALTEFAREVFVAGGLPPERLVVKPNFILPDPGMGPGGEYALFAGRLVEEKGIRDLLQAWDRLGSPMPLRIAGGGPLLQEVQEQAARLTGVTVLSEQPRQAVLEQMRGAAFLVLPSRWFESFPQTLVEAYAAGTPVIGPQPSSISALIREGETGRLYPLGSPDGLDKAVRAMLAARNTWPVMRLSARREYENHFTAEINYARLMEIYQQAAARRPL